MGLRFKIHDVRSTNSNLFARVLFTACCLFITAYSFSQTEYAPPTLTCVRNNSGDIELNWQLPATPNPCFSGYEIYASIGNRNGPYSLNTTIASAAQTTTLLTIASGGQPVYFYMINRGSCNNPTPPSRITSDTLDNVVPQPVVTLQKITVINNHAVLSWYPSPSPEVVAYLIYTNLDGFASGDTVFGRLNTSYTDLAHDPKNPIIYKIRAFEYCENSLGQNGSITPNTIESRAMIVSNPAITQCPATISLTWNAYKFGNVDPLSYEVQTNVLNAGFVTKANIPAGTTSFILPDFPAKQHFCARIKANLPGNDSSFSNEICFDSINVWTPSKDDYIRNITVENGTIIIEYKRDSLATLPRTVILQRSNDGIAFDRIVLASLPVEPDRNTIILSDPNLAVNNQTYTYTVELVDSCFARHTSDTVTTLRLGIKLKTNNRANIVWTGFDIHNISFDNFRLEKIDGDDTILVGNFNRNQTEYAEAALFDYSADSLGPICYRVTALFEKNNDKAPRQTLESHSNIVCVQPEPKAYVPQAFRPAGYNKTFKPFLIYAKAENYDFKVFDRWYQLVYSTNDVNASWDGTFNGNPAPLDGYIYVIKFKGKDEKDYMQTGTVMLIR